MIVMEWYGVVLGRFAVSDTKVCQHHEVADTSRLAVYFTVFMMWKCRIVKYFDAVCICELKGWHSSCGYLIQALKHSCWY
jgi:hypothetical protein